MKEQEQVLQEKIRALQDNVASLRMSRRVLMTLMEQARHEREDENKRLKKEKLRLQKENSHYAKALWEKNRTICELERRLQENPAGEL
ncbi:MAG: translation initiation factor 2 [Clostridiales bacterium]|nr:translation initiation factor 2 [Clostridiales bacterium]